MPSWEYAWPTILVVFIVLGVYTTPLWFKALLKIIKRVNHMGYARRARKNNEIARLLRLERTEYFGYPLPTGKSGTLRLTSHMMIQNPHRISSSQLERVYRDRARDLKVDMQIEDDVLTRDILISWHPHKGRWPREVY